jgi:hypothetical protein
MAKLLVEKVFNNVETLIENDQRTKEKQYYIEGIFLQADTPNRNNRVYPLEILQAEVDRYIKESIETNLFSGCGELNHPASEPSVNPDRISHRNLSLRLEGKNFIGKAKILNTDCGKLVKLLMDEGLKPGVSSRGLGSLTESDDHSIVQNDFRLSTIDIVSDPSVKDAIVDSIMESKEWEYIDGQYVEITRNRIRKASRNNLTEAKLLAMKDFLTNLKIKF